MADPPTKQAPSPASGRVLLVIIMSDPRTFDAVVTMMLDLGLAGTVAESKGLMALIREEIPIFSGLASMLPQTTGSRVILSVAKPETAEAMLISLEEEFAASDLPIAFTIGIDRIVGARN